MKVPDPGSGERDLKALLEGYRPTPGVFDEMMDAEGRIRPHWKALVSRLASVGPREMNARFEVADSYLKDSGVYYRVYDDTHATERPWPLSHMPLLISPEEWKVIERGVVQRARLIEAVLKDAYGPGKLVEKKLLPATAIAGSPDFLRPLVKAGGKKDRHLFLYAVDLGRSPTGQWWVIRDRTQAPSGTGYALENRIAMSRAMSEIFRTFDIERLAPFFDRMRADLAGMREPDDAGVCILSPGPLNETYFEHTYLARYLGMRLVEGVDLMVQNGAVYLRTVEGARKVRVLIRRVDGDFADPLELNTGSQLGIAGLVQSIRRGSITVANSLGSGLAEARALLGFLPALAEPLLGEPLTLPNVATWWCGQPQEREAVLSQLDDLVIATAFGRTNAVIPPGGPWVMSETDAPLRDQIRDGILRRGVDFVGQEVVKLSTTPVWNNGTLKPHPFMFRVFVFASDEGYTVMPGGFAVIGESSDLRAVSMQRGARSADVWVLSNGPVAETSLLVPEKQIAISRGAGSLPSRAADNLFWLARYIERADATLRLVRALASRLAEGRDIGRPEIYGLAELLFRWGASGYAPAPGYLSAAVQATMTNAFLEGSVPSLVSAARKAASVIRDRIPADSWRALDDLDRFIESFADETNMSDAKAHERASAALRNIAAVTGFQLEVMNRHAGWRFMKLGLRIERAIAICRYTRQFVRAEGRSTREELEAVVELNDSLITYRTRYPIGAAVAPVLDLVLLDESNPRSLIYQLQRIEDHAGALPLLPPSNLPTPALQRARNLLSLVTDFIPARITLDDLLGIENSLLQLSDEIAQSFLRVRDPAIGGTP